MPLTIPFNFNVIGSVQTAGNLSVRSNISTVGKGYAFTTPQFIQERLLAYQDPSEFEESTPLELIGDSIEGQGYLQQIPLFLQDFGKFLQEDATVTEAGQLLLNHGSSPNKINPFKEVTQLHLIDSFDQPRESVYLNEIKKTIQETNLISLTTTGIVTSSADLELVDELGPQVFNQSPAIDSTYNNPDTYINFDLVDTGGSDIALSGVDIYVAGIQVIDAGVNVTPSGYGITIFTPISTTFYQFEFRPENSFSPDSPVTVSGRATDSLASPNTEFFNYEFRVWKADSFTASIVGLPDADPPFLTNLDPYQLEIEVPINTNIDLEVNDLHTGVNFESVVVSIDDEVVYSGQSQVSPDYTIITSGTEDGRGLIFNIDPATDFEFSSAVAVGVYAEDLYIPSINILDTTYNFVTVNNSHLAVSGLQVYEEGSYIDMTIDSSYTSSSSTQFHLNYYNFLASGVDITASTVSLNSTVIPSTITPVSGSTEVYDVSFEIEPDYTTDADLVFYVQQSGLVAGEIVGREFYTELLWGYAFCYENGELTHDRDYVYVAEVPDQGDYPTYSSLVKEFSTVPLFNNTFGASIVGIDPIYNSVNAEIIPNSTYFEYGKEMFIQLEAKDFAGNTLLYRWNFKIEEDPELG